MADDGPLLGLATTEELFRELITRLSIALPSPGNTQRALILAEMLGGLYGADREYRTAEPYAQEPSKCVCGAAGPEPHHASCLRSKERSGERFV